MKTRDWVTGLMVACFGSAVLLSSPAYATILAPGESTDNIGIGSLAGATLIDSKSHPFSFVGSADVPGPGGSTNPYSFTGSFNEYIYREPAGTLDFAYDFTITTRTVSGPFLTIPLGGIRYFSILDFPRYPTDEFLTEDVLTSDSGNSFYPTGAQRVSQGIGFNTFVPPYDVDRYPDDTVPEPSTLLPKTFFIRTNATQYDSQGIVTVAYSHGFYPGDPVSYRDGFQPVLAVPEPATLGVLLVGVLGLAWRGCRRAG